MGKELKIVTEQEPGANKARFISKCKYVFYLFCHFNNIHICNINYFLNIGTKIAFSLGNFLVISYQCLW